MSGSFGGTPAAITLATRCPTSEVRVSRVFLGCSLLLAPSERKPPSSSATGQEEEEEEEEEEGSWVPLPTTTPLQSLLPTPPAPPAISPAAASAAALDTPQP
jgi:hypothetical protein